MSKNAKTNAMRLLDRSKIKYEILSYDVSDGKIDGLSVAQKMNQDPSTTFKTLVTASQNNEHCVFVIPVCTELDLKAAARATGQKNIAMIPQAKLLPLTGYIHGGCSPIGMKKHFVTIIDESAKCKDFIFVSGGKIGLQIKIAPDDLSRAIGASYSKVARND